MAGWPELGRHGGRRGLRVALFGAAALTVLGIGMAHAQSRPADAAACAPSAQCAIERAVAAPTPARTFTRGRQQAAIAVALAERDPARAARFLRAAQATLRAAARGHRGQPDGTGLASGFSDTACLSKPDACLAHMAAHPALARTLGAVLLESNADFHTWREAVLAMGHVDAGGTLALLESVPSASERGDLIRFLLDHVIVLQPEQSHVYRLSGDHWRSILTMLLRELSNASPSRDENGPDPARGAAMALLGDFAGGLQMMSGHEDLSALDDEAVTLFVSNGLLNCRGADCRPFLTAAQRWAEEQGNRARVLAYMGTSFGDLLGLDAQLELVQRYGAATDQAVVAGTVIARLTLAGRVQELDELAGRLPLLRASTGDANPTLDFVACFGQGRRIDECFAGFAGNTGGALNVAHILAETDPAAMGWSTTQWIGALHGLTGFAVQDEPVPADRRAFILSWLAETAAMAGHAAAAADLLVQAPADWHVRPGLERLVFRMASAGNPAAAGLLQHVAQVQLSDLGADVRDLRTGRGAGLTGDCWNLAAPGDPGFAIHELAVIRCTAIAQAQVGAIRDAIATLEALEGLGFGHDGIGLSCIARVQAAQGDWAGAFATMERHSPTRRPGRIYRGLAAEVAVGAGLIGPPDWSQVALARVGETGACTWATAGELMRPPLTVRFQ